MSKTDHCAARYIPALRLRFLKKIQDWILKSEGIRNRIFRFFNLLDGSIQDLADHGASKKPKNWVPLKKRKIHIRILSDLKIQSWIVLKKRTLMHIENIW